MNQLQVIAGGLQTAFNTLNGIAQSKGHTIQSVTVSVDGTNLQDGTVVGNVTVANRSRRAFKIVTVCGGVEVNFLGVKEKIAA